MQQTIALRYACSKLGIDFDGFVACMIRLETLFSESLSPLTPSHFSRGAGSGRGQGQGAEPDGAFGRPRGQRNHGWGSVTVAPLREGKQKLKGLRMSKLGTPRSEAAFSWGLTNVPSRWLCSHWAEVNESQ